VGWENLRNDSNEFVRDVLFLKVPARCGITEPLAWVAACDDVGDASPWASVEGSDIAPYREARKDAISLALK